MIYQNKYKGTSFIKPFSPKRPVKSFLDLEIYQKSLAICVVVVKRISGQPELQDCVIAIPRLIATAHSLRFSDHERSIAILEDCMLKCNLAVVYLEQYRDLYNTAPEVETVVAEARDNNSKSGGTPSTGRAISGPGWIEEQTKNLLSLRMKIMRLQISWKKFREDKKDD